jgi:hypothetical protein
LTSFMDKVRTNARRDVTKSVAVGKMGNKHIGTVANYLHESQTHELHH